MSGDKQQNGKTPKGVNHTRASLSQMMKNKQRMKILFPLLQQWEDVLMHSSSDIQFWLQYGQKEESYEPSYNTKKKSIKLQKNMNFG